MSNPTVISIGSLSVSDAGVNDPAIADHECECMICNELTDHVSGVCDACNEEDMFDVFAGDYDYDHEAA